MRDRSVFGCIASRAAPCWCGARGDSVTVPFQHEPSSWGTSRPSGRGEPSVWGMSRCGRRREIGAVHTQVQGGRGGRPGAHLRVRRLGRRRAGNRCDSQGPRRRARPTTMPGVHPGRHGSRGRPDRRLAEQRSRGGRNVTLGAAHPGAGNRCDSQEAAGLSWGGGQNGPRFRSRRWQPGNRCDSQGTAGASRLGGFDGSDAPWRAGSRRPGIRCGSHEPGGGPHRAGGDDGGGAEGAPAVGNPCDWRSLSPPGGGCLREGSRRPRHPAR